LRTHRGGWLAASIGLFVLLPPAPAASQDFALARLEESPRHHEWVEVKSGDRSVHCFVAYPESAARTLAVVVIHENRGLTDWVRSVADQLAEAGYLAVAPDLLSGFDEKHGRTSDFATSDAARDALYRLDPERITSDLAAVSAYAAKLPAATGKVAVAGFCWGGAQAFRFATNARNLAAVLVFYGAPPDTAALPRITAPVYGFYGEDDERINATIDETRRRMRALGKAYEVEIYPGAGHAFLRRGDDPSESEANRKARDAAWGRLERILGGLAR
jgi:carboxymethylenebutenolidase